MYSNIHSNNTDLLVQYNLAFTLVIELWIQLSILNCALFFVYAFLYMHMNYAYFLYIYLYVFITLFNQEQYPNIVIIFWFHSVQSQHRLSILFYSVQHYIVILKYGLCELSTCFSMSEKYIPKSTKIFIFIKS